MSTERLGDCTAYASDGTRLPAVGRVLRHPFKAASSAPPTTRSGQTGALEKVSHKTVRMTTGPEIMGTTLLALLFVVPWAAIAYWFRDRRRLVFPRASRWIDGLVVGIVLVSCAIAFIVGFVAWVTGTTFGS
jgi:hypothetical protein